MPTRAHAIADLARPPHLTALKSFAHCSEYVCAIPEPGTRWLLKAAAPHCD
jgi:hypothetical protein